LEAEVAQANAVEEVPSHLDDLGVEGGVTISDGFKAELLMLSVSPLLRPLISEDGGQVVEPHRLGEAMHTMLQIGTTDWGCALRPQGHLLATAIGKGVGLLLHNVGSRADGANKKAGILKNRGIDALIAVDLAQS
jgi:hypothetical protein